MQVNYDKLWKLMIDKKINKTQLSELAEKKKKKMAKMGKDEMVKMETLIKICKVLECKIDEIIEF